MSTGCIQALGPLFAIELNGSCVAYTYMHLHISNGLFGYLFLLAGAKEMHCSISISGDQNRHVCIFSWASKTAEKLQIGFLA